MARCLDHLKHGKIKASRDEYPISCLTTIETAEQFALRIDTEVGQLISQRPEGREQWIARCLDRVEHCKIKALRDDGPTSYVAAIKTAEQFDFRTNTEIQHLIPSDQKAREQWMTGCLDRLEHGKINVW